MSKYGKYVLVTDSTCDLPAKFAQEHKLEVFPLVFLMQGKAYNHYLDAREMSLEEFYTKLKSGVTSQTTQISYHSYMEFFEPFLKDGKDILYICFTSGLSGTYNTSKIAARDLLEKYPDREINIVDSRCASVGEGLIMYHIGEKFINEKPDMTELTDYAESIKLNVCHWFVVDDIEHLKRGGRISSFKATFAKALQIKPLISVDNDGKLVNVGKVRGSNNVYDAIIKKLIDHGEDYENQVVLVGHANFPEGAQEMKKRLKKLVKDVIICDIGPIIGTHVGAGMLGLAFMGQRILED